MRLAPHRRVSDGPDACTLAAAYGLSADPWQELIVSDWMALAPDGRWAHTRCGCSIPRQNGKNGCLEIRELYGAILLGERILHTAHEVKTARKHFRRLLHFFDNPKFPDLRDLVEVNGIRRTNGQEAILLTNGGSIEIAARSKGSGRGWSVDLLVCDEAQDLNDDEIEALRPTISASPNPQTILTGTPPKPGVLAGEVFVRYRQEAIAVLAAPPEGDGRLCWDEYGIPTQDLGEHTKGEHPVLDDPQVWADTNPAHPGRLSTQAIEDDRSDFSDDGFARERLGMWPKMAELAPRVISKDAWETDTLDKQSAPAAGAQVAIALDVTPNRTAASIGLAGRRADGRPHVEVIKYLTDLGLVVETIKGLVERNDPVDVVLDGASPARSFITELQNAGIDPTVTVASDMAAACGLIYDEIAGQQRVLRHRDDELLDAAVGNAAKRDIGDGGFGWSRRRAEGDISPLVAVTLARWGLARHEKPPAPPASPPKALPASGGSRGETTDLANVGF